VPIGRADALLSFVERRRSCYGKDDIATVKTSKAVPKNRWF